MWEEFDMEMDPAFLERDACRKAGKPVEIARTKRTVIRESVLSDVEALYRIGRLPQISPRVQPMQPTLKEEREFMEAYIGHAYLFYDYGLWTILHKESGQIIGRAGLMPSEILEDAVELGYMITPEYQKQGFAYECGNAILNYAHDILDLAEVHLLAEPCNEASVKTAEKLGFLRTEVLYQMDRELLHYIWRIDE